MADKVIFEAPRGQSPEDARDCSDELLPDGELIDDKERAAIREQGGFKPKWKSVTSEDARS